MVKLIKKIFANSVFRYLFAGVLTTLVNLVVFNSLVYAAHINYVISNVISVIVSIIFAFFINKLFVFRSNCDTFREAWVEFYRFVLGRASTLVIEVGGVSLCVELLSQPEWVAKLETQVIVMILNYFISKFLVFRSTEKK